MFVNKIPGTNQGRMRIILGNCLLLQRGLIASAFPPPKKYNKFIHSF